MKFFIKIIFILFLFLISPNNFSNADCIQTISAIDNTIEITNKRNNELAIGVVNSRHDYFINSSRNSEISQNQNRNNSGFGGAFGLFSKNKELSTYNYLKNINYNLHILYSISPKLKNVLIARAP